MPKYYQNENQDFNCRSNKIFGNIILFQVYCCSKNTHCDRFRVYYNTYDKTTEQVQINSPEGLAWPGTEFETAAELVKPFPDYHQSDQSFTKYVKISRLKLTQN